jgi:hypothetical protein
MATVVAHMSQNEKIMEAIRRSLPMLPADAREVVESMLEPVTFAIVAGTLVVWAGSHFVGIGEIVDVVLLATGVIILGFSVFEGASELCEFATTAIDAKSDIRLNEAARHFSKAVSILGISVVSAILLRGTAKSVVKRPAPRYNPMPRVGYPPPAGMAPKVSRPYKLANGAAGQTDVWGNISVARTQSLTEQRLTLYHEWVHRVLSPRVGPFRRFRAQLSGSAYERSALLRYLEEAMAESFAQFKVHGMGKIIQGIRFPVTNGYLTVSQAAAEGLAIGNIVLVGMVFRVFLCQASWEKVAK